MTHRIIDWKHIFWMFWPTIYRYPLNITIKPMDIKMDPKGMKQLNNSWQMNLTLSGSDGTWEKKHPPLIINERNGMKRKNKMIKQIRSTVIYTNCKYRFWSLNMKIIFQKGFSNILYHNSKFHIFDFQQRKQKSIFRMIFNFILFFY